MREGLIRLLWPALLAAAFCIPLFIGLGSFDLQGDEAGHSFSVDRIIETGGWLVPASSPNPDFAFLEKPPLKFWIVAAGILAGLPHDEFGLRFWDPVFGGIAFLYVFAIGRRLDGPVCGAVAVLLLFVNRSLLFEHGLRTNNMEAGLLLSYCGGVFHYLGWTSAKTPRGRQLHAIAVCVYFALGFMLKFVAALFLPLVLGLTSLLVGTYRRQLLRDRRPWLIAVLIAVALTAPWFLYATWLFGSGFWEVILGTQVYTRLTAYLDPEHLHPWHHYFTETYLRLAEAKAFWLVAAGAALLVVDTVRRRSAEGLMVLMWFAVPVTIMSLATSKLYHYAYPFLPPVGLAGGYLASRLWTVLRPRLDAAMSAGRPIAPTLQRTERVASVLRKPLLRIVLLTAAAVAVGTLGWTLLIGPFNTTAAGLNFRNSSLLRPAIIAGVLLYLGGQPQLVGRLGIALLILMILPIPAYRATLRRLQDDSPLVHPARDCVLRVGSRTDPTASRRRGMYVDGERDGSLPFNHEFYYYFRRVEPWIRQDDATPSRLHEFMTDPAEQRPLLMSASRYHAVLRGLAGPPISVPRVSLPDDVLLVLPGPYAECEAELTARRPR